VPKSAVTQDDEQQPGKDRSGGSALGRLRDLLWKRRFDLELWGLGIIVTLIITVVTTYISLYPEETKQWIGKHLPALKGSFMFLWNVTIYLFAFGSFWFAIRMRQALKRTRQDLTLAVTTAIDIPNRRWNRITSLHYAHLEYDPFLKYDFDTPTGFGVYFLEKLMGKTDETDGMPVDPEGPKRNWNNVIDVLKPGVCDVVATPLFATFERSMKARFTAPLFFSNIGLYMNTEAVPRTLWEGLTVDNLKQRLDPAQTNLRFLAVKGEISEKLAKKFAPGLVGDVREGSFLPRVLIKDILDGSFPPFALFCETYVAERQIQQLDKEGAKNGKPRHIAVQNVLPWNSILYPVCFAVHRGDYQLANLLNIRLLHVTQAQSALEQLGIWLMKDRGIEKLEDKEAFSNELKRHFVAEWPYGKLRDGVHV
jgi:hypothetical protein